MLEAGSELGSIKFTYTADDPEDGNPINMNGGRVRLDVPAVWKVKDTQIMVVDGWRWWRRPILDEREAHSRRDPCTREAGIRGPALKNQRDLRRITLTIDGDGFVTKIEVELDSAEWSVDRATREPRNHNVTGSVAVPLTVPIPASLDVVDGIPFESYRFTTWSAAATGGYARLTDTDDNVNTPTHPEIKVGNIPFSADAGILTAGTPTVTPTMYVGDEGDVKITFTAAGPIYDIDSDNDGELDVDAQIVVDLSGSTSVLRILQSPLPKETDTKPPVKVNPPPAVTGTHVTQLFTFVDVDAEGLAPQTSYRQKSGFISITKRSKVVLGNPALTIVSNVVTINIVKMDTGGIVELTYKKMWAADDSTGFATVAVTSFWHHCGGVCSSWRGPR